MAKKSTTRRTERHDLVTVCAFWGMAIAALMFIISGIITLLAKFGVTINSPLSGVRSIATLIGQIALVIAIALPAYNFVRGKSKGWKIFFWIMFLVYVLGVVFGVLNF